MKNLPRVLVLIDPVNSRYTRYVGKQRTHDYDVEPGQPVSHEWIELLRIKPESWKPDEPEAA